MELRELEDYKAMDGCAAVRQRRQRPEKARGPEALLPLPVQAAVLQRRNLPAFNRPNVTLVDVSASKGVQRITGTGIVADGVEYEVDCIIFASGFEITTELRRRFGIDPIMGRDGLSLYDHWANGYRTFHGMMSHGFPNQFFTGFTQAGVSANTTAMFEQQGSHIAWIIKETLARGAATVEPSQQAQDQWVRIIRETSITDRKSGGNARPAITTTRAKRRSGRIWASPTGPASTPSTNCSKNGATGTI